ncbi:protein mst2 [Paecilomyces variotii No. 5]|uniref:Histone acetyltransferase n=1 Tax=Byssochlamys spectabilis (strain No. 5 / NBRC 109023) TaxID=1356009 RepID=V5G0S1_BYSSN|nr:protein mst2 [Paecilomyces variotii No. 5]
MRVSPVRNLAQLAARGRHSQRHAVRGLIEPSSKFEVVGNRLAATNGLAPYCLGMISTGTDPVTVLRVKVRDSVRFGSAALVVVSFASPRALFDLQHPLSACSNIEIQRQIASFLHLYRAFGRDTLTIHSIIAYQVIACFERGAPNNITVGFFSKIYRAASGARDTLNLATEVTYTMAATAPATYDDTKLDPQADVVDSDQDAEGEEDTDLYQMDQQLQDAVHKAASGHEDDDASQAGLHDDAQNQEPQTNKGKDVARSGQEEDDDDEAVPVGAVKLPEGQADSDSEDAESDDGDADAAFEDESNEDNEKSASGSGSDESDGEEEDWEAESNDGDDGEGDKPGRGNCIFCGQDEEHDPAEEYEEYLTCAVCGDHSHRQCAREQEALKSDDDAEKWRCPSCVQNQLEPDPVEENTPRRRSGLHNITKELLPAHIDSQDPESHSIFNTVILDDPTSGSRSLRKRKASSVDVEEHVPVLRKRQRRTASRSMSRTGDAILPAADGEAADTSSIRTRPRRTRKAEKEPCRVVQKSLGKLILAFRLDEAKVSRILSSRPRPKNRKRKPPKPEPVVEQPLSHFAPISTTYVSPFYSFHDGENDELKSKPYGGILSEADADTSRTLPTQADREKFELARRKAEEDWQKKIRETEPIETANRASAKLSGPPSKIKCINFGGYEIETWYAAPYPEEYSRNRVLYICEFCLKYMNSDFVAWRHKLKCPAKHPPGDEIYRDGSISIFEVDGRKNPVYCQNLCLLAKLFLGSKTLYYDVEPFLFYVMTEYDDLGCHFVGYFSKEKRPSSSNNVSCILTLPIHQRKGYGHLLIDFSYLLTRVERKTGSPEKPLSDMGLVSYRNYWRLVLSYQLRNQKSPVSIADLSERTGMTPDDIVSGLEGLRALVRDPVTKTYALRLNYEYFEEYIRSWESKGYVQLNPDALVWTPYIMGRSNQSHYDRAPIHTVAQREEEEEEEEEEQEVDEEDGTRPSSAGKNVNGEVKHDTGSQPLGHSIERADGLPYEPAGPPPTAALSLGEDSPKKSNGIHPPSTTGTAESSASANPAAGIPPTRFEVFPPIQGVLAKRRPGRPFGRHSFSKVTATPTAPRTTGRNTPRRSITLASGNPATGPSTVRRGRSAKLFDALTAESPTTNGNGEMDEQNDNAVEQEAAPVADQDSAKAPEANTTAEDPKAIEEPSAANGTDAAEEKIVNGSLEGPEVDQTEPPKEESNEGTTRTTRSFDKKPIGAVEKIEVVISSQGDVAASNDSDVDAEGEDVDAEGDIVLTGQ